MSMSVLIDYEIKQAHASFTQFEMSDTHLTHGLTISEDISYRPVCLSWAYQTAESGG